MRKDATIIETSFMFCFFLFLFQFLTLFDAYCHTLRINLFKKKNDNDKNHYAEGYVILHSVTQKVTTVICWLGIKDFVVYYSPCKEDKSCGMEYDDRQSFKLLLIVWGLACILTSIMVRMLCFIYVAPENARTLYHTNTFACIVGQIMFTCGGYTRLGIDFFSCCLPEPNAMRISQWLSFFGATYMICGLILDTKILKIIINTNLSKENIIID